MTGLVFPLRALAATLAFSIAGLAGFLFAPQPWAIRLPNAVFYAMLVLNTFYSVRYFDALEPRERDERVIDTLLAIAYLGLAAAIGAPLYFAVISSVLFVLSIVKYALLVPVLDRSVPLRRKIRINSTGLLLGLATIAGALFVDPLASAWFQAIVFAVANIYLLWVNPMYAAPAKHRGLLDWRQGAIERSVRD